jgi:hypothetical protein
MRIDPHPDAAGGDGRAPADLPRPAVPAGR